nr:cation transporting ATPase C-terminal domain-containing protein [Thermus sp. 2.9]
MTREVLLRALGVLGPLEALWTMATFLLVLFLGNHAAASGSAFAAVVFGQAANALASRSDVHPLWRLSLKTNPFMAWALLASLALLFLTYTSPLAQAFHHAYPGPWLGLSVLAFPLVALGDALLKAAWRKQKGA